MGKILRALVVLAAVGVVVGVASLAVGLLRDDRVVFVAGMVLAVGGLAAGGLVVVGVLRRISGQLAGVAGDVARLRERVNEVRRRVESEAKARPYAERAARHDRIRDVAALLTLHDLVPTPAEHVPLSGYSALPATLLHLVQQLLELPAGATVVELGSGASTVWMALAAQRRGGDVRIISLDHDAQFAAVTQRSLARNGVDDLAAVRVSELRPTRTAHGDQPWYDASSWADLDDIGLVFIDGPPGATGPMARFPALEALAPRLAPGAVVVLDDTERDDERALVEAWLAYPFPRGAAQLVEQRERTAVIRVP